MTHTTFVPQIADDMYVRAKTLGHSLVASASQHYREGYFHNSWEAIWYPSLWQGALCANLWRYADDATNADEYHAMSVEIIERAFRLNLFQDAAHGNLWRFSDASEGFYDEPLGTDDTTNMEAVTAIARTMYTLDDSIDLKTRYRWLFNLKQSLTFLGTLAYPYFYVNGNFAVNLCSSYWYVADQCRKVGDQAGFLFWQDKYEVMYNVTVNPYGTISAPDNRWQGYGRIIEVASAGVNDWSDATGYLTETPSVGTPNPSPSMDWYYTTLQLDMLASLYVDSRDFKLLQLINMIHNKIVPRINTSTWILDASSGSRKAGSYGFQWSWMAVILMIGSRASNRTLFTDANIKGQWDAQTTLQLTQTLVDSQTHGAAARQWDVCVATVLRAACESNRVIT